MWTKGRAVVTAVLVSALVSSACGLGQPTTASPSLRPTCPTVATPSATSVSPRTGDIKLTGIVRSAETCAGVDSVRVGAYDGESGALLLGPLGTAMTDASGVFAITVPEGTYRMLFMPPSSSGLATRWWKNEHSYVRATSIKEDVSTLDMLLPRGFSVSGHVVGQDGVGTQASVTVSLASGRYEYVTGLLSDGSGQFSVALLAGDYRFRFESGLPWASQWFNSRASQAEGDNVVVARDVTDLNVTMVKGPIVSGRVVYPDSRPVEGTIAFAALATTRGWCCEFAALTYTAANGTFGFALPRGTYRIGFMFTNPADGRPFAYWWPSGSRNMEDADPVAVERDRGDIDLRVRGTPP